MFLFQFMANVPQEKIKHIDTSFLSIKGAYKSSPELVIAFSAILFAFIAFITIYQWFRFKDVKKSSRKYQQKKEEAKQNQLMDISETASKLLIELANKANTVPERLITNNDEFEKAVNKICALEPVDPLVQKLPGLREDLGFIFFNRRAPFITSKMLIPGNKIRVGMVIKTKKHSYVSTVLNTSEKEFWVKPPTSKGKVVNLRKFKTLEFRVFRRSDGEFRFFCKLKKQISKPVHAIVLEHSDDIKRLPKRKDDRYRLQFERRVYFVNNVDQEESANISCVGTVVDISNGGMKFNVKELPIEATVGTNIVFDLKEAKIKHSIHGSIVRTSKHDKEISAHIQFTDLSELDRLYLQKFISNKNAIKV